VTRVSLLAAMLCIASSSGVPSPPNLRPFSRAGAARPRVCRKAARQRALDAGGFGVAGCRRFGRAWGAPSAMESGRGQRRQASVPWHYRRCPGLPGHALAVQLANLSGRESMHGAVRAAHGIYLEIRLSTRLSVDNDRRNLLGDVRLAHESLRRFAANEAIVGSAYAARCDGPCHGRPLHCRGSDRAAGLALTCITPPQRVTSACRSI
jgi:hypothetical protein